MLPSLWNRLRSKSVEGDYSLGEYYIYWGVDLRVYLLKMNLANASFVEYDGELC